MPKVKITKQLVEMIAEKDNSQFVSTINDKVNGLLSLAVENLADKVSYISTGNVTLQPINEIFNNAFVDGSEYVYLLGVENAQLQLNTIKKEGIWKNFKKRVVYFWKNRKALRKKKKRRRKKDNDKPQPSVNFDQTSYTIFDLAEDLQQSLSNFLTETSMIYLDKNTIQIVGKEDLGSNVKIVIHVISQEKQIFKHFISMKSGYLDINLANRFHLLSEKQFYVGENLIKMLRVFNSLYFNVNGRLPNQIFMESVLCAVPEDLFQGDDIYKVYLKIVNYISLKSIRTIKSINDPSKTIHDDKVCGGCGIGFNKMLAEIGNDKI